MNQTERLKGIEHFVVTADAGSFTAAADQLHLTSSAVSKSVARLESRLGIRLFERTTRRLSLTDAGAAFYTTCQRVLRELKEAESVLASHHHEPTGRLRLDAPATFGRLHVWPAVLAFAKQYPHLRPQVSFTDRFSDLHDDNIDIAVRIGGPEQWPESIGHHYLGKERLVFCASPHHIATHGTPNTLADLLTHDAVLYGKADGSTSPWLLAHSTGNVERRFREGRIVVANGEAQVEAVKAGLGIAQLATWLIKDELARRELVTLLPELATDGLALHLLWPIGRQLQPKVHALLCMFINELSVA